MIKQVFLPLSLKRMRHLDDMAQHSEELRRWIEHQDARLHAAIESTETDLDAALSEGFTVVSSHVLKTSEGDYLHFVLYRPDAYALHRNDLDPLKILGAQPAKQSSRA